MVPHRLSPIATERRELSIPYYLRAVVRGRFRLPPREAIVRTSFAPVAWQ